jgi:prophage antirepressor-like protein
LADNVFAIVQRDGVEGFWFEEHWIRLVRGFATEVGTKEEIGFVATDLAKALDHSQAVKITRLLDPDQKGIHSVDTPGGTQSLTVISESGFYKLVLRSDKPQAAPLQDIVSREILPQIRKTGQYAPHLADPTRAVARIKGKKARITLQDTLFEHEVTMDGAGIGAITNVTYRIGWGKTAKALRREMNLPDGVSPRDRMSARDLNRLNVHETVLEAQVRLQDVRGNADNIVLAANCGHAVEKMLNQPILPDVDTGKEEPKVSYSPYRVFTAADF